MVGDNVRINVYNGKGVIEEIFDRTSELIRPTSSKCYSGFCCICNKKSRY